VYPLARAAILIAVPGGVRSDLDPLTERTQPSLAKAEEVFCFGLVAQNPGDAGQWLNMNEKQTMKCCVCEVEVDLMDGSIPAKHFKSNKGDKVDRVICAECRKKPGNDDWYK
jgi:hypothetical protein